MLWLLSANLLVPEWLLGGLKHFNTSLFHFLLTYSSSLPHRYHVSSSYLPLILLFSSSLPPQRLGNYKTKRNVDSGTQRKKYEQTQKLRGTGTQRLRVSENQWHRDSDNQRHIEYDTQENSSGLDAKLYLAFPPHHVSSCGRQLCYLQAGALSTLLGPNPPRPQGIRYP